MSFKTSFGCTCCVNATSKARGISRRTQVWWYVSAPWASHGTISCACQIKQPKPFLVKALPYLDVLLRVLAIASRAGVCFGIPIPMIPADLAAQLGMEAKALNNIGTALRHAVRTSEVQVQHMARSAVHTMDTYRVQRDIEIATEDSARIEAFRSAASQIELEAASGPAFRALQVVLEAHDRMGDYGGLFRYGDWLLLALVRVHHASSQRRASNNGRNQVGLCGAQQVAAVRDAANRHCGC